jgi:uncharacterized surface protein with fasciclin (FAS1) repeats
VHVSRACSLLLLAALALTGCSRTVVFQPPPASAVRAVESSRTESSLADARYEESREVTASGKTTIAGVLRRSKGLSTLASLFDAAGMTSVIDGKREYTLITPTDAAFEKLPAGWLDKLKQPSDVEKLRRLLRYHLVQGRVFPADMLQFRQLMTFEGGLITVHHKPPLIYLNQDATITAGALRASNGLVHVTDTVLVPKGFSP